jgi:two-component system, OmpR family, response regulator
MARILVVDDSPTVIQFIRSSLRSDGHEVEALDSFINLAFIVRNSPPDLVILDLNIPALSGLSMGNILRKYETRRIPIVIYSSRGEAEMRSAAKELSAAAVIPKSSRSDELRAEVARILSGSKVAAV